jgi:hypothetical protein
MKPHPYTIIKTVPYETTAFVKVRDGVQSVDPGDYLTERSVPAVLLTRRDYEALLGIEKEYWKLHSRYHQAMNNCT